MSHPLHDEVLRFLARPDDRFEALALEIFAHQYEHIAAYRGVCQQRGATPASIRDWREIPPVPALAFKHRELACAPAERVFLSSGTTQGAELRSRHAMPDLRLYRASALGGLRLHVFPDAPEIRIVSLIPSADEWPQSSLAQMVSWAMEAYGTAGGVYVAANDRFDFDCLRDELRQSESDGTPLCLMTTTGALIRFLDHCRNHDWTFRLPHSSRLMDTGGMKGAPRPLSHHGLLQAVWNTLAIPGYFVVNEYGMSELSSQYYDNVLRDRIAGRFSRRAKVGPPWLRTRFLHPATLTDVEPGEAGLLCHVDLANAGSALAVLTEDIGRSVADGFEIVGRAAGAESRGCSMALAEFLAGTEGAGG
jgi:hypothetical protein